MIARPALLLNTQTHAASLVGENLSEAYARALACDTESAFGGILAFNRALDATTAEEVAKLFAEVVIAPSIDADAFQILSGKEKPSGINYRRFA